MDIESRDRTDGAPEGAPPPSGEGPGPGRAPAPRPGRNAWLYAVAFGAVVLIGLLVAWVVANRGTVEVDWLLGTTDAALALVIFIAAAGGWVIGLATSAAIRRRARAGGRGPR